MWISHIAQCFGHFELGHISWKLSIPFISCHYLWCLSYCITFLLFVVEIHILSCLKVCQMVSDILSIFSYLRNSILVHHSLWVFSFCNRAYWPWFKWNYVIRFICVKHSITDSVWIKWEHAETIRKMCHWHIQSYFFRYGL